MTIEVRLANVSKSIRKKKCCRKPSGKTKRFPPYPAVISYPLQRLYLACLDVLKGVGTVPSSSDVQKLCTILDGMVAEDVGLSKSLQFFKTTSIVEGVTPKVACTTIYHSEKFSLCIFFLPANAVIPLHNHPEMMVFSKLLLGKVHIKAYDLVISNNSDDSMAPSQSSSNSYELMPPSQFKLATLKADGVFTAPCDTSVLYPTSGGNIHAFRAITPCAILDVMGPPYSKKDGRDCSYYRDIPFDALPHERAVMKEKERERYRWLEEIEVPKESEMERIEYMGPKIIETSLS